MLAMLENHEIFSSCVHMSTEVLEKLTRCNPWDTHCTAMATNVFGRRGTFVFARPSCQIRKWSPKHRTSSHIRFNVVTSTM